MANEFKVKKGLIVDGSNTVLDVQGTAGQLFSVTDSLTGDLFSVSDVSGVPILNVNSNGTTTLDGDLTQTSGNATFAGTVKTSGASIGITQADGDYLAKLYQSGADGFLELFTGEATPVSRVKLSSYGDSLYSSS
tara:strand:- start:404 stop:808 length:405 start_codon:yes stop_codon:yes gene_type:complete